MNGIKVKKYSILVIFLLAQLVYFFLLVRDIPDIQYSYVGDETDFFVYAKDIMTTPLTLPLITSQSGVFGYHPKADSVLLSSEMKILGVNLFGWKMMNILVIALASLILFITAYILFNEYLIALAAVIFFEFSRIIFAYGHIGYNNLYALIPFSSAFLFYLVSLKYKNNWIMLLSGVCSGFCFYTFYPARIIVFIIPLLLIRRMRLLLLYLLGFTGPFLLFVVTNKSLTFTTALNQSFKHPEYTADSLLNIFRFIVSLTMDKYIENWHFLRVL